jgi:nucleoside-diphosphate-sugar epimerase
MILVTGGTGFVGSHLVDKLHALGKPVRCLVRPASAVRRFPEGVESAVADWASGRGVEEALRGVDLVFHLAGVTKALSPAGYYDGNARVTQTLARALQGRPIRLVHVSSLAAVGPSLDGLPVDEEAPPHPVSTYGRSKLEGERIARTLLPDAVIVRPPVVYGPRDTAVFQILKAVAQGLVLEIAGGERWFSAIYVEDLVEGLWAAANHASARGRAYFLTYRKPATWRELGDTAGRIMERRPRTLRIPVVAASTIGFFAEMWSHVTRNPAIISREKVAEACCRFWTCDGARAAAELGFDAPTPLETGLAKTLAWYKEKGWLKY